MRDYVLQVVAEHKGTAAAVMASAGAAVTAFLNAIPDSTIGKLAAIAPVIACIFAAVYSKQKAAREAAEARKINAETIRQEIENEMLRIELDAKRRAADKKRRKEDKEGAE